jgi:hypothetical protein
MARCEECGGAQRVRNESLHVQLWQAYERCQQVHWNVHRESRGQRSEEKGRKIVQTLRSRVTHAAFGPGRQKRAAQTEIVEDGATVGRVPRRQRLQVRHSPGHHEVRNAASGGSRHTCRGSSITRSWPPESGADFRAGTAVAREEFQVGAVEGPGVELGVGRVNRLFNGAQVRPYLVAIQDLGGGEHHEQDVVVRPVRKGR